MVKQASRQAYQPTRRAISQILAGLFPAADGSALPSALHGQPALAAAVGVAALLVATVVLLLRVPGPPWAGLYAEDQGVFLVGALAHPWHLFAPYAGYLQLLPRLIGQFAAYVPLREAALAVTLAGTAVAAGCALFIFGASAGHIRSAWWRAMLAAAVLLLPVAPLEIADSGVNAPWYLMFALFWAMLWRPRSRAGMAAAAAVAFLTTASDPLALVLAPLLAARVAALRRVREHAVTAGWAAGCLLQLPVTRAASAAHQSRLRHFAPPVHALSFYAHDVVLPALGWHFGWHLQSVAGRTGATAIVGCVLAAVFGAIIATQPGRVRLFVLTALLTGLVYTLVAATITSWVSVLPVTVLNEPGARYTTLPIFLFASAAIVTADAMTRKTFPLPAERLRAVAAASAIAAVLATGWVADYRYQSSRSQIGHWAPVADRWLRDCEHATAAGRPPSITVPGWAGAKVTIPCSNLRR